MFACEVGDLQVINVGCRKTAYKFCEDKCQFGGPGNLKQAYGKKYLKLAKPKNQVRKHQNTIFNCTTDIGTTVQSRTLTEDSNTG